MKQTDECAISQTNNEWSLCQRNNGSYFKQTPSGLYDKETTYWWRFNILDNPSSMTDGGSYSRQTSRMECSKFMKHQTGDCAIL